MRFTKTSQSVEGGVQRHLQTSALASRDYGNLLEVVTQVVVYVFTLYVISPLLNSWCSMSRVCIRPGVFKPVQGYSYSPTQLSRILVHSPGCPQFGQYSMWTRYPWICVNGLMGRTWEDGTRVISQQPHPRGSKQQSAQRTEHRAMGSMGP